MKPWAGRRSSLHPVLAPVKALGLVQFLALVQDYRAKITRKQTKDFPMERMNPSRMSDASPHDGNICGTLRGQFLRLLLCSALVDEKIIPRRLLSRPT